MSSGDIKNKGTFQMEERLNTLSHALGIILGILGGYFLWRKDAAPNAISMFSILTYSSCIVLLFTASTLYHYVVDADLKRKFRILDHISIYFLIAGTYTPVALILLGNGNGWPIFYTVWGIAVVGTVLKLFFTGQYEFISLLLYLAMGWLIVFDFRNLMGTTTELGRHLLFLGGGCYTLGIVFYAVKKIPFNHFIWHLFVLAGAICHWWFIYLDVVS